MSDRISRRPGGLRGRGRFGPQAGLALLFAFLAVAFLRQLADYDVWYHLVIGSEVVDRLAVPDSHFYKYPLLGESESFHEWGFGVLAYAFESALGDNGLSLLNALVGAGTLFLLFLAMRTGGRGPWWLLLWVLAATYAWSEFRFVARPETLLYLALAAEILVLERFLERRRLAALAVLPALSFALSQAHPSAIVLVVVFLGYGLNLLAGQGAELTSPRRLAAWWLAVAGAMVVSASVNPYGPAQVLLPLDVFTSKEIYENIEEFLPALRTEYRYHFLSLAAVGLAATAVTARRRPGYALLYAVFAYLAFRYVRNVALGAVVLAVPIAHAASILWDRFGRTLGPRYAAPRLGTAAATAAAAFALVVFPWVPLAHEEWGVGLKEGRFPVESADLMSGAAPRGRILNFYHLGGYLAWALKGRYRVFIDGHNFRDNKAVQHHNYVFLASPQWQHYLQHYGVGTIITPATLTFSGKLLPLVEALAQDPDWELVLREKAALVFLRRDIAAEAGVQALDKAEVWRQVIAEAEETAADYPDNPGVFLSLATAHERLGEAAAAVENYERYIRLDPGDEEVKWRLHRLRKTGG